MINCGPLGDVFLVDGSVLFPPGCLGEHQRSVSRKTTNRGLAAGEVKDEVSEAKTRRLWCEVEREDVVARIVAPEV